MTAIAPAAVPAALLNLEATFLPIGRMRQIARVTRFDGPMIEGEVDLGPEHWIFALHFPRDPIVPGTMLIEAAGQLVALWAWGDGQRGRPRLVRTTAEFHAPAGPQDPHLTLRATVKRKRHLHFSTVEVRAGAVLVATVEAVLAVLGEGPG